MHTKILKRCGTVLIVIGALDIAYMVWCISSGKSYHSSLNIFALVGGILLFRGNLKAAGWIAIFSTFLLVSCVVVFLIMPFMYPLGYWMAVFRFGIGIVFSFAITAAMLALIFWVRQQVLLPEVQRAQIAAGLPPPKIKLAVIGGVIVPIVVVALLAFMFSGETSREAIRRAELQLGSNYHYVVTNVQMSSNMKQKSVYAIVAAYNDSELKSIAVSWKE